MRQQCLVEYRRRWPTTNVPRAGTTQVAAFVGCHYQTAYYAANLHNAEIARRTEYPDTSPWLSREGRAFLDGVLAVQGYEITSIEPPPTENGA